MHLLAIAAVFFAADQPILQYVPKHEELKYTFGAAPPKVYFSSSCFGTYWRIGWSAAKKTAAIASRCIARSVYRAGLADVRRRRAHRAGDQVVGRRPRGAHLVGEGVAQPMLERPEQ